MLKKIIFLSCLFFIGFTNAYTKETVFKSGENKLIGHYFSNLNSQPSKGVIIFIHGDGDLSYDANGYYNIIWLHLRKNGYSIFSWNKPGVNGSTGNWLYQSMKDRQLEVLSAINFVQKKYGYNPKNTGLLGFSQAGWVIPGLANNQEKIGFMIGIGFAKNWIDQGRYLTKVKNETLGKTEQEVQSSIEKYNNEITLFNSVTPYSKKITIEGMSKKRFHFVLKNYKSDATVDYQNINIPTLLLWGENDLNVDAKKEYAIWEENPNKNVTTKLIANASHGLLKSKYFNSQQFSFTLWLKLLWLDQDALAPTFIPTMLNWLELNVRAQQVAHRKKDSLALAFFR